MSSKLITASPESIQLSKVDLTAIEDIVNWQREGFFPKPGRSAWLRLQNPVEVRSANTTWIMRSVKIKGVGLMDHHSTFYKPCAEPFNRFLKHLGFQADGCMVHLYSSAAPLGGLALDRGLQEFFISAALGASGCPSQVPLLIYSYTGPEMTFTDNRGSQTPLCAIVSGLPSEHCLRASAVDYTLPRDGDPSLICEDTLVSDVLSSWAASLGVANTGDQTLTLFSAILGRYGRTLRAFHEAGFYRHNGGVTNLIYSPSRDEIILTDLDSCRPLVECSSTTKGLQHLRDASSPLLWLTFRLLTRRYVNHATPERVFASTTHNPFLTLLKGYYHDVPTPLLHGIGERLAADYARRHKLALSRHKAADNQGNDKKTQGPASTFQENRKSLSNYHWIDWDETHPFYALQLFEAHDASKLGTQYPVGAYRNTCMESLRDLLGNEAASYIRSTLP